MGLNPKSVGPAIIERAVRERCGALHFQDIAAYWDHVKDSPAELQQLVELVIVPETWFFRDGVAFKAMAQRALAHTLSSKRRLRLLSLPCSTGEEPYSMAMALLDAGVPRARFHIDAVDICTRSIATAQAGMYGSNSFRGKDLAFQTRHFVPAGKRYKVSDEVRSTVRFRHGNLFDPTLLAGECNYDMIFCRNALIYFGDAEQARAVRVLGKLLDETGLLFVGPSEGGVLIREKMVSANLPLAFAFRKAAPVATSSTASAPIPSKPAASLSDVSTTSGITWAPKPKPSPARPAREKATHRSSPARVQQDVAQDLSNATGIVADSDPISLAAQLADQGQLKEAAEICQRHIRADSSSADAYYLLGLISDAAGNATEAREHYRKALYLNPQHPEALIHLAALLDMHGDTAGARRMTDRARRATTKRVD
ncbi:tetratricopeptide repeat protein [Parapusillimonas sp. SGNA-6]|nr:tetratricopeptide repeat protein [Parapusillimonas sp. SGNA-6]